MLKKELISNIYTEQEKKINDETILRIAFSSRCNGIVSNLSYCVRCGKNNEISNIKNDISYLEGRKARIDYTQLIKEPTSSLYPVFPKKKLIILVTGILSLLIFSILALSLEYIEKFKVKSS